MRPPPARCLTGTSGPAALVSWPRFPQNPATGANRKNRKKCPIE